MNYEEVGKFLLGTTFKQDLQQKRDAAVDQLSKEFVEWVKPYLIQAAERGASSLKVPKEDCQDAHKIFFSEERAELIEKRLEGVAVTHRLKSEKGFLNTTLTYNDLIFKWD